MTRLILGCGYLGRRVSRAWLADGREVAAVTRSPLRAEELGRAGIRPIVADVTRPETLASLPRAETVLYSIGFDPRRGPSRRDVTVRGLQNVLEALDGETGRLIYTSTTGVIGDHRGAWVDEATECRPVREAGRLALEAEELLRGHPLGSRAIIVRLAGLYGPGRIPKLADIQAGRPVAAPEGSFLNLIHVDDAVKVILAAESKATLPRTYLASDGSPTGHREFYREIARRLGARPLQFTSPAPGSRAAAAALGNKRVSNRRMLEELEIELRFPSFRQGLAAILSEGFGEGAAAVGG